MQAASMRQSPPQADSEQQLKDFQEPIHFDWGSRWLKGHEYEFMLKNVEAYSLKFGIQKYPKKTHPQSIYKQPLNGNIYFVQGTGLGSQFGFPRIQGKKKFRWKKMNFCTNLPKKKPKITYIVASTTNSHQINDNQQPLFRMHAVVPYSQQLQESCGYILCHILQIKKRNQQQKLQHCFAQNGNANFYKLFALLHNLNVERK